MAQFRHNADALSGIAQNLWITIPTCDFSHWGPGQGTMKRNQSGIGAKTRL